MIHHQMYPGSCGHVCLLFTHVYLSRVYKLTALHTHLGTKTNKTHIISLEFTCYLNPPNNLENKESSSRMLENGRWPPEKENKSVNKTCKEKLELSK